MIGLGLPAGRAARLIFLHIPRSLAHATDASLGEPCTAPTSALWKALHKADDRQSANAAGQICRAEGQLRVFTAVENRGLPPVSETCP